jgi:hypothetical protein
VGTWDRRLSWGSEPASGGEAVLARSLAGARIADAERAACGVAEAGLSLPPGACRQCTHVAVATTVPHVIALGSIGGLLASSIVMLDRGGPLPPGQVCRERQRNSRSLVALGRAGTLCG